MNVLGAKVPGIVLPYLTVVLLLTLPDTRKAKATKEEITYEYPTYYKLSLPHKREKKEGSQGRRTKDKDRKSEKDRAL